MKVAIQLTARKRIKVLGYSQQRRHTDSFSFCTFVFLPFCTLRQFASIPVIGFQLQSHRDYKAVYGLRVICFLWRNQSNGQHPLRNGIHFKPERGLFWLSCIRSYPVVDFSLCYICVLVQIIVSRKRQYNPVKRSIIPIPVRSKPVPKEVALTSFVSDLEPSPITTTPPAASVSPFSAPPTAKP